jgi:hypothetical protein
MAEWNGFHGAFFLYQCELPYDVPGQVYHSVAGHHVHQKAEHHVAKGVWARIATFDIAIMSVFVHLMFMRPRLDNRRVFTVWLNGNHGVVSIINGKRESTTVQRRQYIAKTESIY